MCGWDGEHRYLDTRLNSRVRAACPCGWVAPRVRHGRDAGWQAVADYDDHVNG